MSYSCKLLADSVSPEGHRLTTFEITFPRFILAEVNTHRMLSRNSASSRAIPIEKSIAAIENAMFVPAVFGKNQRGMQAAETMEEEEARKAETAWRQAGLKATQYAYVLKDLGVHKAWGNRVLEPYKWHTAIVTATEWSNFFALRTHQDAQPEFREIAGMMKETYEAATPIPVPHDHWHLPLVSGGEITAEGWVSYVIPGGEKHPNWDLWKPVSVGRCARVSVEQHDGTREPQADVRMHDRLLKSRHLSPFEHVARPFSPVEGDLVRLLQGVISREQAYGTVDQDHANYLRRHLEFQGNLRGWHSARMDVAFEHDFGEIPDALPA